MATSQEEQFKRSLQRFLGRSATTGEVEDFKRSGQTSRQAIEGLFGSQGFRELQEGKARDQFAPVLERLKGEEAESSLAAQTRSRELPEEILGQFSRRGLLRSGGASRSLTEGLAGSARQRALERADIAARKSQALGQQNELINSFINDPRNQFFQEQEALQQRELQQQQFDLERQRLELEKQKLAQARSGGGGSAGGSAGINSLLASLFGGQEQQPQASQPRPTSFPPSIAEQDARARLAVTQNTPQRSVIDRLVRDTVPNTLDEKSGAGFLTNLGISLLPGGNIFQAGRSLGGAQNAFKRLFGR